MNKLKIINLILFLLLIVIIGFKVEGKMSDKKDVSTYITLINELNKKQDALQVRYKDDVLNEDDAKKALSSLSTIIQENNSLISQLELFKTDYPQLEVTMLTYEDGLHAISDAYQTFYYAMQTNEKSILSNGDTALEQADSHFRKHEESLNTLAKKNFIALQNN